MNSDTADVTQPPPRTAAGENHFRLLAWKKSENEVMSNFLLFSVYAAKQNEVLIQDWHYTTIILINPTILLKVHVYSP